jgi:hypothetical protein
MKCNLDFVYNIIQIGSVLKAVNEVICFPFSIVSFVKLASSYLTLASACIWPDSLFLTNYV